MGLDIKELSLDICYISPRNVRSETGDLTELIASIRDMGVLEPILVRQQGEEYEVIAGRRRLEAARSIGLPTIPASVLDVTDLQAIIISLIENVQRKDLTLAERVETYQLLRQLDAEYQNHHNLAKATGFSHQKISQDFQADEIRLKLEPHGIRVASHLPVSADERQESKVLPEYHAVLLHQAMAYLETEQQLVVLAEKIAAMSQAAAKDYIEAVKEGRVSPDAPENQLVEGPSFDLKQSSHRHTASRHRKVTTKQQAEESSIPPQQETAYPQDVPSGYQEEVTEEADGGVVTCAFCKHQLTLSHLSNGTHQLIPQAIHPPENQMALPGLDI